MNKQKVLIKKCEVCGIEIVSLYPTQLEYNFKQHFESHDLNNKEVDTNGNKKLDEENL